MSISAATHNRVLAELLRSLHEKQARFWCLTLSENHHSERIYHEHLQILEAVEHHIAELEALGVRRPTQVPCFYRVSASLLNNAETIQVPGKDSSGETEFVLLPSEQGLLIGLGSDHTDRKVESYDVTVSKQMCDKPIAQQVWRYTEVQEHWDHLVMRDGVRALYQEGPVTNLLAPQTLLAKLNNDAALPADTAMFCGTQSVIGELGYGEAFEMELFDPVLNRSLRHQYGVELLPAEFAQNENGSERAKLLSRRTSGARSSINSAHSTIRRNRH